MKNHLVRFPLISVPWYKYVLGILLSIGDNRLSNWDCIFAVRTVELVLLTIYRRHLLLTKPHAKDVECDWQLKIMGLFLSFIHSGSPFTRAFVFFFFFYLRGHLIPLYCSFFDSSPICRHDCPESTVLASQHLSTSCSMAVSLLKLIFNKCPLFSMLSE